MLLDQIWPTDLDEPKPALTLPDREHNWTEFADCSIGFRPAEACDIAASMFPGAEVVMHQPQTTFGSSMVQLRDRSGRWLDTETGEIIQPEQNDTELPRLDAPKTWTLNISAGVLSVRVSDERGQLDLASVREFDERLKTAIQAEDLLTEDEPEQLELPLGENPQALEIAEGRVIEAFSRRARNRCRTAGARVDWLAACEPGDRLLMLTLTYPGEWRQVAPDPATVLAHRKALEKRFERATGRKMSFIWKREFQERGAPHLHLFGPFPIKIEGEALTTWLSRNWYEIVASDDVRHLWAGTGVDWKETIKMSDPNRVGNYFASYMAKGKYKDYQNHAPPDWTNPNGSVGRYWGTVGLDRIGADVRLTKAQMVELQRYLRRVLESHKRTMRTKDTHRGRGPSGLRRRYCTKRYRLKSLKGAMTGFTYLTNDGPQLALDIARALALADRPEWPPGQPRPLP